MSVALHPSESAAAQTGCDQAWLQRLNDQQRSAATFGCANEQGQFESTPLLIIAGAGTGKTMTLANRVAYLVVNGVDPARILLLTFSRRAAQEMTRRAERLLVQAISERARQSRHSSAVLSSIRMPWAGTFHAIGARLLREHAAQVGLASNFGILDRGDSADLIDLLRHDLGLSALPNRFPRKDTCLAIYSLKVNTGWPLQQVLAKQFPWCEQWHDELSKLFRAFVERKLSHGVLDFDDLLLWWDAAMSEPAFASVIGAMFDHVLVDEYQDTNSLQARILLAMKPDGKGVTVVGDDAQSIYSFRAADVGNILEFPSRFEPPAKRVTLETNYRSIQPVLDAANTLISQGERQYPKTLRAQRAGDALPKLVTVLDDRAQADWVVKQILQRREQGVALKKQAVLFRSSHHSDLLELELTRRNIPYVKYGGLKFLEAAHIKDVLAVLRWVENPRNGIAAFRCLQLLDGMGPANAKRCLEHLQQGSIDDLAIDSAAADDAEVYNTVVDNTVVANTEVANTAVARVAEMSMRRLASFAAPASARAHWPAWVELLTRLSAPSTPWAGQLNAVLNWYQPLLEQRYDDAPVRAADLAMLATISDQFNSRERFLTELTLDPPNASGDLAGDPLLDEDYLILSTVHSAKGQEWDSVYVLNVADGNFPNEFAGGDKAAMEEERRLLYVAITRARDHLQLIEPQRYYVTQQPKLGAAYVHGARSRFLTDALLRCFERGQQRAAAAGVCAATVTAPSVDVAARLRKLF